MTPTIANEGMRYFRLAPDARLRPWIKCYWWVEPNRDAAHAHAELPDLLIPDGHSELVFRYAGEFTRWPVGEPSRRSCMTESYVIGGRSTSVLTMSPGGLRLAGVKLDPRALRRVLGRPLSDLRDNTVTCADLGCRALLALADEIADLGGVERLADVCDRFFLQRLAGEVRDDAAVEQLLGRIRATRGAQPILEWAREQRVDVRTLERRFTARLGMTPKQFARVERFKHVYHLLSQRRPDRARAHLESYYDDSHFDREFRHFMGTSPWSWLAGSSPFTTIIGDHLLESTFSIAAPNDLADSS
jgi:AraC-like DNA-binding protein